MLISWASDTLALGRDDAMGGGCAIRRSAALPALSWALPDGVSLWLCQAARHSWSAGIMAEFVWPDDVSDVDKGAFCHAGRAKSLSLGALIRKLEGWNRAGLIATCAFAAAWRRSSRR